MRAWVGLAVMAVCLFGARASAQTLEIRPMPPVVVQSGDATEAAFLVYNAGKARLSSRLALSCPAGSVEPSAVPVDLEPAGWQVVTARVALGAGADSGELVCQGDGASGRVAVRRGLDLSTLPWRRTITPLAAPLDLRLASPATDDSGWDALRVPALWEQVGYAWCRVHFSAPEAWRGRPVRLTIGAVDDNDVTFLNGEEIGRTNGWDAPRSYLLPERLIRWGQENVLCVRVENVNAGGGIYKAPVMLLVGSAVAAPAAPAPSAATARPAPGKVGAPLPLRRMHVERGVLRYPDGAEVALWGVNYYPQSWHQFENMAALKVDMKATIRQDLDHLQKMGVEAIRIHVFDREISDGEGNLQPNVHLDLLDYLVSECSRRGIYMYFTPIAWWGGPNERKGAFSGETSKPGMLFVPAARKAAAHYLTQFLTHVNRYSGRAYRDEPCLCLLEVQNEPAYFLYGDLNGEAYGSQGERPDVLARDHRIFREQWQAWLKEHNLAESPVYFALFRYEQMRRYIREMVAAIRSTGAKQPVAISYFGVNGDDLTQAITDSECEAITVSAYPGGWERVNDGINLLPQVGPLSLDARLAGKARLAYEFDTPATNVSCYLYPALAAHFRSAEVQVACQFQYDSVSTARWNTDWGAHWLNWLYTPTKAVSYMIGGEAFRRLPRGVRYSTPGTEMVLGPMATSFAHNVSLLMTPDTAMYARTMGDWKPLSLPSAPKRIVGTGSSRWVRYGGTGLYVLQSVGTNRLLLTVNPDARLVGNCLVGSFAAPVAELEENPQWFKLTLPGWEHARCYRAGAKAGTPLPSAEGGWLLRPGEYEIRR